MDPCAGTVRPREWQIGAFEGGICEQGQYRVSATLHQGLDAASTQAQEPDNITIILRVRRDPTS